MFAWEANMRVFTVALIALLAAGAAWAVTPVEVLKGAKSIHVIAPSKALDDITDTIIAELPQVNIEGSREDADVIVRFIVTSSTTSPASSKPEPPASGDRTGYTGKIGKNDDHVTGDAIGTVSARDPKSTAIVFMGPMSEEAAKSFVRDLIKAWKEANPETAPAKP
jgi:hypothetical protein